MSEGYSGGRTWNDQNSVGADPARHQLLIRIETKAGHGAGKPTAKLIEEQADIYGFLVKSLGVKM